MAVQRLGRGWESRLRTLLEQCPEVNLFLLGFLEFQPVDHSHWYGYVEHDVLTAVVLLVPGRLVVPWAPVAEHAAALGRVLSQRFDPCMLVGPRGASDALWSEWASSHTEVDRYYDQRLYVLTGTPPGPPVSGFRKARMAEWRLVATYAGLMEEEDLGRNPQVRHPALHERVVRDRVKNGRTWVIERDGRILFQINIGTHLAAGCQIGGTYVPVEHRGQGYGTEGVRALCQDLARSFPFTSLHVNEANPSAVRIYEKVGFERSVPYRLITVR